VELCCALVPAGHEPVALDLDPREAGPARLSDAGLGVVYRQAA
jgi:hypothetical protein